MSIFHLAWTGGWNGANHARVGGLKQWQGSFTTWQVEEFPGVLSMDGSLWHVCISVASLHATDIHISAIYIYVYTIICVYNNIHVIIADIFGEILTVQACWASCTGRSLGGIEVGNSKSWAETVLWNKLLRFETRMRIVETIFLCWKCVCFCCCFFGQDKTHAQKILKSDDADQAWNEA